MILLLGIQTLSPSSVQAQGIGIRAKFQGGTLHIEWDSVPAVAAWRVSVGVGFFADILIFSCGHGIVGADLCPSGLTQLNFDFTRRFLDGEMIGSVFVSVSVEALGFHPDGEVDGPIASGRFSGTLITPPILLEKDSDSDHQSALIHTPLPKPLTVRLTRLGQPMKGLHLLILWSVKKVPLGATGQRLGSPFVSTGGADRVATSFTLGSEEGVYQIEAFCDICGESKKGHAVLFTAEAIKKGNRLEKISGDGLGGAVGEPLTKPLVVRVTDAAGKVVQNVNITYEIIQQPDGARVAGPQHVGKITGPDGTASATLTLGDRIGDYIVEVTCAECTEGSPQTFKATAVGPEGCTLNGASIASQVNFASGNLFYTQNLLSLTGTGPQVNLTLAYNSIDSSGGPLGAHWTHPYAMQITRDSEGFIALKEEDGRRVVFEEIRPDVFEPIDHFGRPATRIERRFEGGHRLLRRDGTLYLFNSSGHLTEIVDRNRNTLSLGYTGDRLTELVDAAGRLIHLVYNSAGRLIRLIDPQDRTFTLNYDAGGQLAELTDAAGRTTLLEYDSEGRMTTRTDPDGNRIEYTYDMQGRLIQVVDPSGLPVMIDYRPEINQAVVTDREGGITTYTYDSVLDVPVEIIAPDGGVTRNEYNLNRNLLSTTDPDGNTTRYTYDDRGNTLTVTDPEGRLTRYAYESVFNQVTAITDPQGNVTTYTYDSLGNLLTLTDPTGGVTRYAYDLRGRMIRLTNPLGQATRFGYDAAGNLISVTDPAGATTKMAYDAVGNLISRTDAEGATTRFEYDAANRMIRTIDPLGNILTFGYDGRGNRISQTDPMMRTTRYAYNHLNRLAQVTDPIGGVTVYTYDAKGNLLAITDTNKQTTTYTYDALDRLLSEADPLGSTIRYAYDRRGNLVSKTDAEGRTILYRYDALGRLIEKAFPDQTTETFTYDPNGRILTASNPAIAYRFTYDAAGRTVEAADSRGYTVQYQYNAAGDRTKLTHPDGLIVTYGYDDANRLATLTDWSNRSTTFSYDLLGRRVTSTLPNRTTSAYEYDPAGRLTGLLHQTSTGGVLDQFIYTYNAVGNRLSVTRPEGILRYAYDPLDRLTEAMPTKRNGRDREQDYKGEVFTYDPVGNRLSGPENKDTYLYNEANQLLSDRKHQYQYDQNGNLIRKTEADDGEEKVWSYSYDFQNRLLQVIKHEKGEKKVITFKYDPFGKRIEKKVEKIEGDRVEESKTHSYVYDQEDIILELLTKVEGKRAGTEVTRYLHGPGVDEPILIEQDGETYFYHADGLGSIAALTDERQKDVQRYDYTSFGELKHRGNKVKQPYTFTGREWDDDIDLYYYRARYYDAEVGRFSSFDPILRGIEHTRTNTCSKSIDALSLQRPQELSPYVYVLNNPLTLTDPFGEAPWYGNYCGPGSNLDSPIDGLDAACQTHDNCYAAAGLTFWDVAFPPRDPNRLCAQDECDDKLCSEAKVFTANTFKQRTARLTIIAIFCD